MRHTQKFNSLSFYLFFFLSLVIISSPKSEIDIKSSQIIRMKFSQKKTNYSLQIDTETKKIFISERSLNDDYFVVSEQHFEDVSKLKAYHNGKKVSKKLKFDFFPKHRDEFFSTTKLYVIENPFTVKKDDTLSYSYRVKINDLAYTPIFKIPSDMYTDDFQLIIDHPKNISVDFDILFARDSIPYTVHSPLETQTYIRFQNVSQVKPLPYFEQNSWQAEISLRFYTNDTLITPSNPRAFVDWYKKLTPLAPVLGDSDKYVLQEELSKFDSGKDKLRYIHNYVKNNFRYIADLRPTHTITPFPPSQILASKYGDCKDRACLVSAIAKEAGLPVSMAVVTKETFIDYQFVHSFLYNHVICYYEDDTTSFFFDPTGKYYSFDFVPEYLGQKQALILNPDNPETKVIQSTIDSASLELSIVGNIDSLASCKAHIILRNRLKARMRESENEQTRFEHSNYLRTSLQAYFYKFDMSNFEKIKSNDSAVVYEADIDISKFIISSKSKTYIPKIPFTLFDKDILERKDDSYPLHFEKSINVLLTIDLQTDSLQTQPDSLKLDSNNHFQFISKDFVNNNHLQLQYKYFRNLKIMSGEDKTEFLAFCKEYINSKNKMYILNHVGE